jgi:pyruvate dehydrogenase E2 component (dihydrolipoamide acetyltransferase)
MPELLRMPEVAANTTEAVLSSWPVPENSAFARDDVIATVETAKAVVDVAAEADGVLLKVLVAPGAEVAIGEAIALIGAPGEQVADLDAVLAELGVGVGADAQTAAPTADPIDTPEAAPSDEPAPTGAVAAPVKPAESPVNGDDRVFASPLARRLAREAGLSVDQLTGTGPNGRIVRRDVEQAQAAPGALSAVAQPSTEQAAAFTDVPHTKLKRLVASRLTESKLTAPHFYLRGTARVDRLLGLRAELNEGAQVRVSVNDLVVKAVAHAHLLVPALNVTWGADAVRSYSTVDVAVAVATENGLVTPVLRSVELMTVTSVARTVQDLVERAGAGRLQQHELEGGSISVTNLGMYGTEEFAAIINPPQASILAVGAARQEPVVIDGELRVGQVMRLTLSVDHRPVDGVVAAQWMRVLVDLLEHPARILA